MCAAWAARRVAQASLVRTHRSALVRIPDKHFYLGPQGARRGPPSPGMPRHAKTPPDGPSWGPLGGSAGSVEQVADLLGQRLSCPLPRG